MKTIIAALCLLLLASPALAATDQQQKTKACNAAADKKGLKGDQRKAYIKTCVAKAKTKPDAPGKPETKGAGPATTPTAPAKPSAASTAASPSANPNSAIEKKRAKCDEMARQSNVAPARKKEFMDKCIAG